MIPVEVTQAPWHFTTAPDLFDHWQTVIAGVLAFVAGVGTIVAAIKVIAATRAQTETTVRLERRRVASEGFAFHAMLEAAMGRVLADATESARIFASANPQFAASPDVYKARQSFRKSAFQELRAACVGYGGNLTAKFLDLESDIDKFTSEWSAPQNDVPKGHHAGFQLQLGEIKAKAKTLREEAIAGMKRANIVIAKTEP